MNTRYQSSKLSLPSIQVYQNLIIFLPYTNFQHKNKQKIKLKKNTPKKISNPFLLYVRVDLNYNDDFRVLEQKQKNG